MVLLPATSISASSSVSVYPATDVVNFGINEFDVWCTYNYAIDPYILLDFTSPVMITGLVSGGYNTDTRTSYVTKFTVDAGCPSGASCSSKLPASWNLKPDHNCCTSSVTETELFL